MTSHKYFNYTGLINTPLCEAKTSCAKRNYSTVLLYSSVAQYASKLQLVMTSQLSALYASMASRSESLTRTYHIQCIRPNGDLVRRSGTLNFLTTISM